MEKVDDILSKIKEYINKLKIDFKKVNRDNIFSFIKDRKYLITIILVIIIFMIMAVGKITTSSRDELLNNLEVSMKTGKSRKVSGDILMAEDKISKNEIEPLIKYYNSNTTKIEKVINELKTSGQSGVLKIKSSTYGIWEDYYLEVDSVSLKVNTNFEEAKIFIDNKEIEDSNMKIVLVPGRYTVRAYLKTDYGDVEKETQVSLIENEEIDIKLDAAYLNIISNFNDSKVFINDKYTNKKVSEIESLGPIPTNNGTIIHLEREFPWGVIKSDKVKISNSPTINIDINMVNNELTTQIESTINKFYESVFYALNKRDYNLIVLANEQIKKKIYEEINRKSLILKNNYEIIDLETKIENSEFKYENNVYKAQIVVKINYSIYKKLFLTSKDKEEVMFLTNMEFIGDEWIINEIQKFSLE